MRIKKEAVVFLLVATLVLLAGYSMVYGGAGGTGAPWFTDDNFKGEILNKFNEFIVKLSV